MRRLPEFLNMQHHIEPAVKYNYAVSIRSFERFAKAEFEDAYLDVKTVHSALNLLSGAVEDSSWNYRLTHFKRYARWLFDPEDEECPKLWRKIEPKKIDWEEKLKSKWLSEQEFYDLLEATGNFCFRACWAVAVSGALRSCELLGLRVGDVEVLGDGEVKVTVSGKTGTRSFPMNQFAPLLRHWLNFHPLKHDPSAPLWVREKMSYGGLHTGLRYARVNRLLQSYCRLAGIRKGVTLHWLKHTKITWTARNRRVRVSDKQANLMFGWSANSDMYKRYTHLHGTDTDDAFRALEGVESAVPTVNQHGLLERKKCFNCNELNAAGSMYCFKCGFPLNEKSALQQAEVRRLQAFWYKMAKEKEQ